MLLWRVSFSPADEAGWNSIDMSRSAAQRSRAVFSSAPASNCSFSRTSSTVFSYQVRKIRALLFHGLCRLGKIDWASESHQELDRCLSRTITASKNFND